MPDDQSSSETTLNTAELGFEQALGELEGIVRAIEAGEMSLEDSIARYERGVKLAQRCRQLLANAEQKLLILSQSATPGDPRVEQVDLDEFERTTRGVQDRE